MPLDQLGRDVRYAVRSLSRSPAFVLVALLSLMLGIGATSAIFSVVYGVLISPYPYAKPDQIWAPEVRARDGRSGRSYQLNELGPLSQVAAFSDVMATSAESVLLTGDFAPESFNGVLLSGNAFNFLGVPPVAGRTIQPSDINPDGSVQPVVVISHRLWLRLFDGGPSAVGRTMQLNNRPHTIVGVMPPRFGWYTSDGFWLPLSPTRTDIQWMNPIMRLAPGVSPAAAEAQLDALHQRLAAEKPATFFSGQGFTTRLRNYLDVTVASGVMRTSLQLLLGAVAFLLLIACANVANLQLARGTARAREMAVRASIGASRGRLVRQLLTESVLLSVAGGALGVAFAYGSIQTIVSLMPEFYVPNESRVAINVPVLLFSLAISILTGIVFGLVPALQSSRADVTDTLKTGRSTSIGSHGGRTRSLLVVAEVALSVVLLVGASLTMRTFIALQQQDNGLSAERVLMIGVPLPQERYRTLEQRNAFTAELLERAGRLPGVAAATVAVPFGGVPSRFSIVGQPAAVEPPFIYIAMAGPDYLRTFGIPQRAGRMFDAGEVVRGDRVVLVNETAAKLWPAGESPIGSRVRLMVLERSTPRGLFDAARAPEATVIGIIGDTRNAGIQANPMPAAVMPFTVLAPSQRMVALRSEGDPNLLLNPLRAQVREMDPEQPLGTPITLREALDQQVMQPRFMMALFGTFAAIGLALAAAGIYSVLSYHVTRRTQELGVRLALGAPRGHVLGLLLTMGGRLVIAGLAVGLLASLGATRLLQSQLFGVEPVDTVGYASVALLLMLVAFVACYLPARRAARVDPIIALRTE
jgi:putative ABC transport system permease protein